jgi:hypothetical protein
MSVFGEFRRSSLDSRDAIELKENAWISQAFFKAGLGAAGNQEQGRRLSRNILNFYDTTLGGARSMNPAPQTTRWADPKDRPIIQKSKGMGRYYRKAHDNNAQRLSICAGIPEFNSLSRYFKSFFDLNTASLVHTGKINLAYKAGYALGFFFTLPFQAFFGLHAIVNRIIAVAADVPHSKFYYLKPTMPIYWNTVTILFNKLATDMGALVGATSEDLVLAGTKVTMKNETQTDLGAIAGRFPDVFRRTGNGDFVLDIKSLAGRSQRMANLFEKRLESIAKSVDGTADPIGNFVNAVKELQRGEPIRESENANLQWADMPSYLEAYAASPMARYGQDGSVTGVDADGKPTYEDVAADARELSRNAPFIEQNDSFGNMLLSELREGSLFVTFDVEYVGASSVSVSNSTKAPAIKEVANSASAAARDIKINLANGNVFDNAVGNAIETAIGGVKDLITGAASSVGLGGLAALAGQAFMSIPDVYDNSSVELPSHTYKVRLGTPYGNKYSILTRVYLPLCMLMALAMPRATGKNSYGPPFLVRAHSQGHHDVKLGIIGSMSFEIGSSNIGRSIDKLPTAIDVTFDIVNLDDIMTIPVADSLEREVFSFSPFDEDTALSDFLATLAGVSLQDQFYATRRITRAWRQQQANWASYTSPTYYLQEFAASGLGQFASLFVRDGDI